MIERFQITFCQEVLDVLDRGMANEVLRQCKVGSHGYVEEWICGGMDMWRKKLFFDTTSS
jgi:hypothetical protein